MNFLPAVSSPLLHVSRDGMRIPSTSVRVVEFSTYGFLSGWYFLLRFLYAFLISRSEAFFLRPRSCSVLCQWLPT